MNVTLLLSVISAVNFNPPPSLPWEQWPSAVLTVFTVFLFLAVGCCVGSFLNVAIWRWPIGRGVTRGTSACPKCGTPILPRDNLPIFGWLMLRGRCRACREPISFRYPLVEAWTGLALLATWSEVALTGGQTLPVRAPDYVSGAAWQIWSAFSPELLYLATLYSVAMCQAIVLTMMTFDGARWRGNTAYVLLAIIAVAIVAEPRLHPLGGVGTAPSRWLGTSYPPDQWPANSLSTLLRADALASVLLALGAGIGLVQLLMAVQRPDRQQSATDGRPDDHSAYTATALNSEQDVGGTTDGVNSRWLALTLALVFGWQTAFALWGVASALALLLTLVGPPRIARGPWTLSWTLALHLLLVSWRWAWTQTWWPGHPGLNVAAWLVVSLLLSLAVTQLQQRQGLSGTPSPSSPPAAT